MKYIVVIFLLLGCHLSNNQSEGCNELLSPVGFIRKYEFRNSPPKYICWTIPVPTGKIIQLKMTDLELEEDCSNDYVLVSFEEEETYKFCGVSYTARIITALSNATVIFNRRSYWHRSHTMIGFHLEYTIKDSECISKDSFKCSNTSCISQARVCDGRKDCESAADEIGCGDNEWSPQAELCDGRNDCGSGAGEIGSGDIECIDKDSFRCSSTSCIPQAAVCDGRKDCENGADEIGCETGVLSLSGVAEARKNATSWLKKERLSSWGWRDYTPRGVVALYLASDATFNGTVLEEELMAKEAEIKIAVALLRPSLTNSELSMFIHALLVTCHDPRDFYGNNLVKRLKEQVEYSPEVSHPISYLALCNAHESWPSKADSDLKSILNSSLEYPFVKDLQAMAILALSCKANSNGSSLASFTSTTSRLYKHISENLQTSQMQDGSFGNLHTTALITQALISSGQENSKDWKLNATVQYLMKELNSQSVDFLSVYLALPILSGKTLTDVRKVNCSANPRKHGDDPASKVNEFLGPKMRIRYTLAIGDEKDVIHTISLRVPENYTAFQTMQLAEIEDQKYKFDWKVMSGKMYVYKIANVSNDPETGKFWLLYIVSNGEAETWTHYAAGPDEVVLKHDQELVFWFKTASI